MQTVRYTILNDPSYVDSLGNDCACPTAVVPAPMPPTPQSVRTHPALQRLSLDHEHEVWFVPSHSRVAVLDRPTAALFDRFATARRWAALAPVAAAAVTTGFQLGLLTGGDGCLPRPPAPEALVAWLHVTNACNLDCSYCYIAKSDQQMSAATGAAAIDAVIAAAERHGYRQVILKYAGGEASLVLDRVAQMHHYARECAAAAHLEVRGGLLSNGVGLDEARLQQVRELGLELMISLDGLGDANDRQRPTRGGRGSAARVQRSIERAAALGLRLTVSITVTGHSVAGLPTLLEWLLERELHFTINFYRATAGVTDADALRLDEERIIAGMREAYSAIARRPPPFSLLGALLDRVVMGAAHSRACAAGENYLVIDHRGRIAGCQMELARPLTTLAHQDPLSVIRLDPRGVRNPHVDEKEGCRSCEWRYWCAGGCPVATREATGRYDRRSPNCAIYQALFPEVVRLEGLRLLHHRPGYKLEPSADDDRLSLSP